MGETDLSKVADEVSRLLGVDVTSSSEVRGFLSMAMHHCRSGEVSRLGGIGDAATRTVALARTQSFEAVHLVVRTGQSIAPHRVAGSMTLYCIAGHVRFEGGFPSELRAGDWLFLDPGTPHEVRAITDSSLLLTILFDESGEKRAASDRIA